VRRGRERYAVEKDERGATRREKREERIDINTERHAARRSSIRNSL